MEISNIKMTGNVSENTLQASTLEAKGSNEISFWRRSKNNLVSIDEGFVCNNLKIVFKGDNNKLIIGANVRWTGHILIVGNNRTITIGDRTTAQGVYILSRDEDVEIGSDCMFSREIEIRSTDVHKIYDLDTGERINPAKKVLIGENVWIGARVIVSKGADIPNGCVIGASSFVNKKFETCNAIIAGTPAKVVKTNIRWER
ncbi:hypothetical protein B9T21_07465 [Wohlfahrtiimonas chitiniclastica]|uniref:acyltransferase n=1 Tax=Wohlfahrtiimonas chitiniclastica TaxID=400946 RepID=UPI000B9917B3|nr:acyltransferase [Wohlfahrtiimonas chitiniclastica]OYQ87367.1 hypothetical protein B9T21_07465 [Wohlfahrtiimonas chitiniclastica]